MQDVLYIHPAHVRQPHAHHGDRQQPGFVYQLVAADEDPQHAGQGAEVVQVFRQPVAAQCQAEEEAAGGAERDAAGDDGSEGAQWRAAAAADDEAEHHHGEQGADGVDDNTFPTQDVAYRGAWPHHPQHGCYHRGAGDQGQGAEQQRQVPGEIQQVVGGHRDHRPGRQCADGHHAPHHLADLAPFREVQGQAALEQDQGDGQ